MAVGEFYDFLYPAVKDKDPWRRKGGECLHNAGDRAWIKIAGRGTHYKHDRMVEVVAASDPTVHMTPAPPTAPPPTPYVTPPSAISDKTAQQLSQLTEALQQLTLSRPTAQQLSQLTGALQHLGVGPPPHDLRRLWKDGRMALSIPQDRLEAVAHPCKAELLQDLEARFAPCPKVWPFDQMWSDVTKCLWRHVLWHRGNPGYLTDAGVWFVEGLARHLSSLFIKDVPEAASTLAAPAAKDVREARWTAPAAIKDVPWTAPAAKDVPKASRAAPAAKDAAASSCAAPTDKGVPEAASIPTAPAAIDEDDSQAPGAPPQTMSAALSKSLSHRSPELHAEWKVLLKEKGRLQKAYRDHPSPSTKRALEEHLQVCNGLVEKAKSVVLHGNRQDARHVASLATSQTQLLLEAATDSERAAKKLRQAAAMTPEMRDAALRGLEAEHAVLE